MEIVNSLTYIIDEEVSKRRKKVKSTTGRHNLKLVFSKVKTRLESSEIKVKDYDKICEKVLKEFTSFLWDYYKPINSREFGYLIKKETNAFNLACNSFKEKCIIACK